MFVALDWLRAEVAISPHTRGEWMARNGMAGLLYFSALIVACSDKNAVPSPVEAAPEPSQAPAEGVVKATVTLADGKVGEGLVAASVESTVKENIGMIQYCYEQALKGNNALAGRIEVAWTIANGQVTQVGLLSNTSGDAGLADCVLEKVKGWTFDPATNGDLTWPFVFQTK